MAGVVKKLTFIEDKRLPSHCVGTLAHYVFSSTLSYFLGLEM